MANFECKVIEITIVPHPNADKLEIAQVGDFQSIVLKGQFVSGEYAVYVPEAAIVPEYMLRELNLWDREEQKGRLAGSKGDRIKAVKLRGVVSTGLLYPILESNGLLYVNGTEVSPGDDVKELLGVKKWEPPVPTHMAGEVDNVGTEFTINFDIEPIQKYPNVFQSCEDVVITEKLHGTWACMGYNPNTPNEFIVTSKGLSSRGLAFKLNEQNANNLYVRMFNKLNICDKLKDVNDGQPIYILGEIFGKGVQDLQYGLGEPRFRVFDVFVGNPNTGTYCDYDQMIYFCERLGLNRVPVLYKGKFSKEVVQQYTDGMTVFDKAHIREGVVIKPVVERYDLSIGRVLLKSVSDKYKLRKNGTEFN